MKDRGRCERLARADDTDSVNDCTFDFVGYDGLLEAHYNL